MNSEMFPNPLYVAIYILGSSSIVFAFDWLNRDEPTVGLQFWRHIWHIPILWIITFISGWLIGFSLHYLLRYVWPILPEFLVLWWLAAFTLSHLGWVALMTHGTPVKNRSGQTN